MKKLRNRTERKKNWYGLLALGVGVSIFSISGYVYASNNTVRQPQQSELKKAMLAAQASRNARKAAKESAPAQQPQVTQTPAPTPSVSEASPVDQPDTTTVSSRSIRGEKLFVDSFQNSAFSIDKIKSQPIAKWIGEWTSNPRATVDELVTRAASTGTIPTIVLYNIPNRDCGSFSGGGANSAGIYNRWVDQVVAGIGMRQAIVIVEPDALAQIGCLPSSAQAERYQSIKYAVDQLASNTLAATYIDAGHSNWLSASEMASRLNKAGVANATGFALNVSNFETTLSNTAFGNEISNKLNGKTFVIDTSRNGNGANGQWCNPKNRKLGKAPTTNVGGNVDAYLWIKTPGESDGECNGGPSAGTWWQDYAEDLAS